MVWNKCNIVDHTHWVTHANRLVIDYIVKSEGGMRVWISGQ